MSDGEDEHAQTVADIERLVELVRSAVAELELQPDGWKRGRAAARALEHELGPLAAELDVRTIVQRASTRQAAKAVESALELERQRTAPIRERREALALARLRGELGVPRADTRTIGPGQTEGYTIRDYAGGRVLVDFVASSGDRGNVPANRSDLWIAQVMTDGQAAMLGPVPVAAEPYTFQPAETLIVHVQNNGPSAATVRVRLA